MGLKKKVFGAIAGMLVVGAMSLPLPASAHGGPILCTFTSATGLPAAINNVEGKGGPWSIGSDGFWAGSGGPDGDPLSGDAFGHTAQGTVSGRLGLYYPVTDPDRSHFTNVGNAPWSGSLPSFVGDHFNWTNVDSCQNNGAAINTKGVGIGYCGRSIGLGVGESGGHPVITKWESAGSQLIVTDPSAAGSLNANPLLTSGSCTNGTAVQFQLNGATVHM